MSNWHSFSITFFHCSVTNNSALIILNLKSGVVLAPFSVNYHKLLKQIIFTKKDTEPEKTADVESKHLQTPQQR